MFWRFGEDLTQTGIYSLDLVLGGGYEKGDWIEIAGVSCSGKTTLLLDLCRRMFARGKKIAYLDVETGVKQSFLENLRIPREKIGCVAGESEFLLISPQTFLDMEQVFNVIINGKPEHRYDIVIIDSMSNVKEYAEDLSITDKETMRRARQEGKFFAIFKPELRKVGTTVFSISQMTTEMKNGGPAGMIAGEKPVGGRKAGHNYDIRLRLDKPQKLYRKESTIMGSTVGQRGARSDDKTVYGCISQLWATKNRSERPEIPVSTHVIFGQGISNVHFLESVLYHNGIIKQKGTNGWEFGEIPDIPDLSGKSGVAKTKLLFLIKEHMDEIVEYLKSIDKWKLTSGEDSDFSGSSSKDLNSGNDSGILDGDEESD